MGLEINTSQLDKLIDGYKKELKSVKGVEVGWYATERALNHDKTPTNKSQGEVAKRLNNGAPEDGLPARPFISDIVKKRKQWGKRLQALFQKGDNLGNIMIQFGESLRNDLIENIDSNMPPPNSPKTIEQKGSSHTLIDTGHMKQSIQVQIIKSEE